MNKLHVLVTKGAFVLLVPSITKQFYLDMDRLFNILRMLLNNYLLLLFNHFVALVIRVLY